MMEESFLWLPIRISMECLAQGRRRRPHWLTYVQPAGRRSRLCSWKGTRSASLPWRLPLWNVWGIERYMRYRDLEEVIDEGRTARQWSSATHTPILLSDSGEGRTFVCHTRIIPPRKWLRGVKPCMSKEYGRMSRPHTGESLWSSTSKRVTMKLMRMIWRRRNGLWPSDRTPSSMEFALGIPRHTAWVATLPRTSHDDGTSDGTPRSHPPFDSDRPRPTPTSGGRSAGYGVLRLLDAPEPRGAYSAAPLCGP